MVCEQLGTTLTIFPLASKVAQLRCVSAADALMDVMPKPATQTSTASSLLIYPPGSRGAQFHVDVDAATLTASTGRINSVFHRIPPLLAGSVVTALETKLGARR